MPPSLPYGSLHSRSVPPGTGSGVSGSLQTAGGSASCQQGPHCVRCVCVCVWRVGGVTQTCRRSQLGVPPPPPERPLAAPPAPRAECRNRTPNTGASAARAGPALSPRPQRALLCSWASAIDSPLPPPAAGKGHSRTGGGGAAPGTRGPEAFTPQPPRCPPRAVAPASLFHFVFLSFLLSLSGQTGIYFFARSTFSSLSHSSSSSLSCSLSTSLCLLILLPLMLIDPLLPPSLQEEGPHLPLASPGTLLLSGGGMQESPHSHRGGLAWVGGSFPGHSGEGLKPPQPWGQ